MAVLDLTSLPWTLLGWRPFTWRLAKKPEGGGAMRADLGPYPISLPGSVQRALHEAKVIPDWNVGVNSRECEWVEHRHWDLTAEIPEGFAPRGERIVLCAESLDYSGWVLVDCVEIARFEGALTPHSFDLTNALSDGKTHSLSVIFEEPPREQGQIGYTSRSHFFKPRYNYSWDWTPRMVPIGVAGSLQLRTGAASALSLARLRTTLANDDRTGRLEVVVECSGMVGDLGEIVVSVARNGQNLARVAKAIASGANVLTVSDLRVEPWWPNGAGPQNLYDVDVEVAGKDGRMCWSERIRVGFRRVEWRQCEDAPDGAEPWICVVNGEPVFLQGANWVPPRVSYPDSTEMDYQSLLRLYKEMGCNVLRVWGGAILETKTFYDLCDEVGIFVWQEFPLSSSGVENYPPDNPEDIRQLMEIATYYIRSRSRHASLLLWSGGNELTRGEGNNKIGEIPVDCAHPCIAAFKELVEREDPGHRFIPTSPSGPVFYAHAEQYGKGLHHDVHGPWGMSEFADFDAWREYWRGDDSLFRSEVGMPGACDADFIRRYAGGCEFWPPVGAYWMHTAAWWTLWEQYKDELGGLGADEAFAAYVERTQRFQAEAYEVAARCCKGRFPKCGGFIVWMGHDLYPCPSNNSVIDFDRKPKPAYAALRKVFRSERENA
jgi:beta-mannosidase